MATQPIPVIATGSVFADYLAAARSNLDALVRLAAGLKDDEFAKAAQEVLDQFDGAATDCYFLIDDAEPRASESYVPSFGMQHSDAPSFGRTW